MFNPFSLSKAERNARLKFRCVHRHNGIEHPACFEQANGLIEKIGYYDIETSNLSADFGIVLSYCILSEDNKIYGRVLTPQEIKSGIFDKKLCGEFCQDARRFNRLIGYYSSKFDAPFLRTRCIYHNIDFPIYKEILHTDAYMIAKKKLNLHSKRLGVVAPFFGIKAKEHPLNGEVWLKCLSGNKEALNFVYTHNKEDVYSLRSVWHKIEDYIKLNRVSL